MAFTTISSALIQVGKPILKSLFQSIKDNEDDLNTRLTSVEAIASKRIFYSTPVLGASNFTTLTGLTQVRVDASIDVTDILIGIYDDTTAITSGTLEIDIVKATGAGGGADFSTSVSLLTTRPSIDFSTASDYDESSNQVINATNAALVEGSYLQINITSKPADLGKFFIYCIGEAS
jgi:hypothetical protein